MKQLKIIDPVKLSLIEQELTPERFLRKTNKAGNEIYVIDAHNSPCVMREIGRLREIAFRHAGGGTGNDYLPKTLELGRSFVRPEYQSSRVGSKGIFALDNLWDGLGALTVIHPEIEYLFGKMTMYTSYPIDCRNLLLAFLHLYFPDKEHLVTPINPLDTGRDLNDVATFFKGDDFKTDYKSLNTYIRSHGINIPPLVNAYMSLSPTMRMLGTAINHEFGDVEESGILIKIDEITDTKKSRHIDTYQG